MKSSFAPRRHLDPEGRSPRLRGSACNAVAVSVALVNGSSRGAAEIGEDRARPWRDDRLNADPKALLLGSWMERSGAPWCAPLSGTARFLDSLHSLGMT